MIPSCIFLNPVIRADLQAACVQAEATVQAGLAQADATSLAGALTLIAGAGAIVAAIGTIWTTRVQIRTARKDVTYQLEAAAESQRQQLSHDLETQVCIPAMKAVSTGLFVATKLADVRIPVDVALVSHQERLLELFAVHLVAELERGRSYSPPCTLSRSFNCR